MPYNKQVNNRQSYFFTFSENHKIFYNNTQDTLNEILKNNKGKQCYLNYIKKIK
jgi:hypothetical protein